MVIMLQTCIQGRLVQISTRIFLKVVLNLSRRIVRQYVYQAMTTCLQILSNLPSHHSMLNSLSTDSVII
jgi:hypothetical protein